MIHSSDKDIVLIGSMGILVLMIGAVITHIRMKNNFRKYSFSYNVNHYQFNFTIYNLETCFTIIDAPSIVDRSLNLLCDIIILLSLKEGA